MNLIKQAIKPAIQICIVNNKVDDVESESVWFYLLD
jgi:hypothetical protein